MNSASDSAPEPGWINVPIRASEPAHGALFKHFLNELGRTFKETPEFIAIEEVDMEELVTAVEFWAFDTSMPDDVRTPTTLNELLREIGNIVMAALGQTDSVPRQLVTGIDLRA